MSQRITTKEQAEQLLSSYDYFLFDCDGVLWLGDHLLPSVVETLDLLRQLNKTLIFVTNNSTKCREDYVAKFEKLGIHSVTKEDVFGSSYAAAVYVEKILKLPKDKKVWVLGETGIQKELEEVGYATLGGADPVLTESAIFDTNSEHLDDIDDSVGAVVAGLALNVNYLKLSMTLQYLLKDKKLLPFVATNIDSTFPMKGRLLIGAGSIVETVAYASGRKPDAVCGKPSQGMMTTIKAVHDKLAAEPKRGLMIGDRLNTDIAFGRGGGLDTLLVLTGIEDEEGVRAAREGPTFYIDKLGSVFELSRG